MSYRGYIGHLKFDEIKSIFCGQVANTHNTITFQGKSMEDARIAFQNAVDRHVEWPEEYDN